MRRAIAAAIDLDQLVGAVSDGSASRTPRSCRARRLTTRQSRTRATLRPGAGAKLAAEAGYKGQPLTMLANKRYPQSFDAAVIVQAMLQSAGINANLEVLDWATQLDRYSTGRYQMMAFRIRPGSTRPCRSRPSWGRRASQPRKVWDDKDAQAILEDSMRKADPAARAGGFRRAAPPLRRRRPDGDAVQLGRDRGPVARVVGYTTGATAQPRLWEVSVRP